MSFALGMNPVNVSRTVEDRIEFDLDFLHGW
jgi:hypothetical protein